MITKEIKIAKLLKEYPDSLEILIRISPHFEKLRNKVLRKTLAGRITLEQAASIGGVPVDKILSELKSAAVSSKIDDNNFEEEDINYSDGQNKPAYLTTLSDDKIIRLDVRPIIESGQDPLGEILTKVKKLKTGEVLVLMNSFEPIPLYNVLGKKGFAYWTEKEENCFIVWFYKENNITTETTASFDSSKKFKEDDYETVFEIDVHDLQPPEPMMKILKNLHRIDEKTLMLVHHHREPILLYPILEERGYRAYCEKIGNDNYKILIGKKE